MYRPEKLTFFLVANGVVSERKEEPSSRSVFSGMSVESLAFPFVVELSTRAGGMSNCEDSVALACGVRMYESTYKH